MAHDGSVPPEVFVHPNARKIALLSPLAVIAAGHITARLLAPLIGAWAWLPLLLTYWTAMAAVILLTGGAPSILAAYRRPGGWPWWLGGILVGLVPAPLLIWHRDLLRAPLLVACWLALAFLNPFFEESYWRGLLGEATRDWPAWIACGFSSVLFAASHPLMWGVFSIPNRNGQVWLSLLVMGLVWSAAYRSRRSLRAATFSHMLVDLFNLSVFAFLNMFLPGPR